MQVLACPLCSGKGRKALRVSELGNFSSTLFQCSGCGLRYLGKIYPPEKLYAERKGISPSVEAASKSEARNPAAYLGYLPAGGSFLEVGFGNGRLLEAARLRGFYVVGNEIADSEDARRLRKQGFRIAIGDIRKAGVGSIVGKDFDVIILSHTIEHLTKLETYLDRFYGLLRPGGRLVIVTPNYGSLFHRLERFLSDPFRKRVFVNGVLHVFPARNDADSAYWFSVLEYGHTFQFVGKTLKELVERHGFAIEKQPAGNPLDLSKGASGSLRYLAKFLLFNSFSNKILRLFSLQYELFVVFRKVVRGQQARYRGDD